jgi:hypothetical protein
MAMTPLPTPAPNLQTDSPTEFTQNVDALLGALPAFVTEANALETNVNAKEASAALSASNALASEQAAEVAQLAAELARNEAVAAAATIPDGTINDGIISTTDTWSSNKINLELSLKQAMPDFVLFSQGVI